MTINVTRIQGFATLQDRGRAGLAHLAIPTAGAFDTVSHDLANRLVGNHGGAATLEMLRPHIEFTAVASIDIAITGAPVDVWIDEHMAVMNSVLHVGAKSSLKIRSGGFGMRSYLAVRGGWEATAVLGSFGFDELAKIGPPPLVAGDALQVGTAIAGEIPSGTAAIPGIALDTHVTLRVHKGPRWDFFSTGALTAGQYTVSSKVNRVGVRLEGPALEWDSSQRLPSEGVALGSIQVPVDGVPLIFGPDHPTTAGYPVIAVVAPEDMPKVAQLAPGTSIRFVVQ